MVSWQTKTRGSLQILYSRKIGSHRTSQKVLILYSLRGRDLGQYCASLWVQYWPQVLKYDMLLLLTIFSSANPRKTCAAFALRTLEKYSYEGMQPHCEWKQILPFLWRLFSWRTKSQSNGKYLGVTEQRTFLKFLLRELIDIKSLTGDGDFITI